MDYFPDISSGKFEYIEVEVTEGDKLIMNLLGKKVLIVGFGKSGQAALRFCLKRGARPAVTDSRAKEAFSHQLSAFSAYPVDWYLGFHNVDLFLSADLIVVSPGVPWNLPELKEARKKGIPVVGEMELALQDRGLKTEDRRPKIIAVTGTNGKTTTVTLIDHLLKTAGKKSLLAGNVGLPLLDCLEEIKEAEFLVLEISSYQMEATPSLRPDVAVWLNVTEDHLDWHEDFTDYVKAKTKLIQQASPNGVAVYNVEDDVVANMVEQTPCGRLGFSAQRQLKIGGWVDEGHLVLKTGMKDQPVRYSLKNVPLKGIHNWENMLASLLAVTAVGDVPRMGNVPTLQKGLESFVPLPHRMQVVREINGVTYVNDSKGTNVGATLKAFISTKPPIVWIAGGKDKGGSYEPLVEPVQKKAKKAIFFGESKNIMADIFKKHIEVALADDLGGAVMLASKTAATGDTVLFSPACSSFDMFKDYVERGEKFKELVRQL